MITVELSSSSAKCTDKVFVVPELEEPILSESALLTLGLISYSEEGKFALTVAKIVDNSKDEILNKLMSKYPNVFSDKTGNLGRFKHFKAEISLAPGAKPFISRVRQIPLHWEDSVRKKLEEMVKQKVLAWCPPDMPVQFVSALVIVKKRDGTPRVTVDFRMLNKYLSRSRITSKLTIENLITKLQGLKYFFTLDISDAFHQIPLKKSCRKLTVIATPWGNLYYRRLAQGLVPSSDIFDNAMASVLQGIPNTCSYRDDVWAGGRTLEEHDKILSDVIARFALHGVVIKAKKCSIRQQTVKFLGHILNAQGIKPDPDKVKSIKEAKMPESKEGLVSFLCTMGFVQRFIPRFSELAGPLHDLARKEGGKMVEWDQTHTAKFEELKNALCSHTINNTFNPNYETSLWCDAGKNGHTHGTRGGFSAVLAQRENSLDPNGWQPVYFASKRMSDPQSRWGQSELESESILFGCRKFSYFLDGISDLTIFTDCKALISIYNKSCKQSIPPRIERGVLAIQHLPYTLVFVPGKENKADWPSRNPPQQNEFDLKKRGNEDVKEEQRLVRQIKLQLPDKQNISWDDIRETTTKDTTLQKIISAIQHNKWKSIWKMPDIKPFRSFHQQLSVVDGVLLHGQKILIPEGPRPQLLSHGQQIIPPENLRESIASQHHICGHQGISKSAALLRQRYYWPGYKKDIEKAVSSCEACLIITKDHRKEPKASTRLPTFPFEIVSTDFKGPTDSGHYVLVITDLYSRWPEMYITQSTSFRTVKKHFLSYFATYGHVKKIKSDGGPPFNSSDWQQFAKEEGFKARVVTPLHPKGNSEAERMMQLVKKTLALCKLYGYDFSEELRRQLHSFRATPNSGTGFSPACLAFGRNRYYHHQLGDITNYSPNLEKVPREDLDKAVSIKKSTAKKTKNTRHHTFKVGDKVLVNLGENDPKQKPLLYYEPELYTIVDVCKSQITAESDNGKRVVRNSTKFKHFTGTVSKEKGGLFRQKPKLKATSNAAQEQNTTETVNQRHTRSSGPVPDQPWIRKRQF